MTPPILNSIDQTINGYLPYIAERQEIYVARYGRYFQGLRTHSVIPADGAQASPDLVARKAPRVKQSWGEAASLPAKMRTCMQCDRYVLPGGRQGYTLVFRIKVGADVWVRRVNGIFAHGWRKETS
jgi:hypothetical protein